MKRARSLSWVVMMLLSAACFASAEGKTIVYWSMWESTQPQGVVIQQAVDAYVAATGNMVDVQFKGRTGSARGCSRR